MQKQETFYPVRITSRSATRKRSRRLSWFVIGTAFGLGCASALSPQMRPLEWVSAETLEPAPAPDSAPAFKGVPPDHERGPTDTAAASPPPLYPLALDLKVENGDTLINILVDTGVSQEEAHHVVNAMGKLFNPKSLDVGQSVSILLDKIGDGSDMPVVASLKLPVSPTAMIEITRKDGDGSFDVSKVNLPVERKLARAGGRIDSSLYETGVSSGLPVGLLSEIITAYSYDVDFQREIRPGDAIDVLFERMETKDGALAGHGHVLFAELKHDDDIMKIYRYVDKEGFADYYNEKGESVRKALLRTPINGARITSRFGMRSHPILGYSKMHRGVDFGAATGTPIYAAGDGTVDFAGRKGGYGNYLKIRHAGRYASAYGHLSRFASGMAPGKKVKQGQIVAYVGSTGMSTGPHLHYEVLADGVQVNPAGIKFKTGNVLKGTELANFRKSMEQVHAQLLTTPKARTDLAMAE